jgi:hypothetical protein
MKIVSYSFGQITIENQTYDSDLIIFPDRLETNWRRISSHLLTKKDLQDIILLKPEILIIGTGKFGLMRLQENLSDFLSGSNIKLIVAKTDKACEVYNSMADKSSVIAAMHLTC